MGKSSAAQNVGDRESRSLHNQRVPQAADDARFTRASVLRSEGELLKVTIRQRLSSLPICVLR